MASRKGKFDSVLLDLNLGPEKGLDILDRIHQLQPNLPVVIFTAQGSVKNAVEAMRRGAVDFLEKPFTREQFHLVLARVQRFHQLNQNIVRLEREVQDSNAQSPEILLDSSTPLVTEVMDTLLRAAKTPASILILGESGTGKSVVARAVHQQSHLANKPFVTVSCPQPVEGIVGKRPLRPHARGLHRRPERPLGQSQNRRRRDAVPGRDWR